MMMQSSMHKIIHLSQDIVSKISAGEVIERPAFAIKELIDNAIDAKATLIEIHVQDAGLKRITVIDNGIGMTKENITLSFLPHTTSKLTEETDLIGIKTLGFRGEALASIAAISHMTIKSRTAENPGGNEIMINNGVLEHISPIGTPVGTTVVVDNLFHSVPARKKFLKSQKTEFRHITDTVMSISLSYPSIHFVLTHNKKPILDLAKKEDSLERVKNLFGRSLFEKLIPISFEDSYIKVSGFIGHPQIASKQNQKQYLFINNRPVTDRLISLSAKEAFGTLLSSSSTPVFSLFISLPHEMVDVNVHPRKEQVSFLDNKTIFDVIKQSISQTLNENNITFRLAKFKEEHSAKKSETTSFAGVLLRESVLTPEKITNKLLLTNSPFIQIDNTYILTLTKEGIELTDQHAAHERILFTEFTRAFINEKEKIKKFELPKPVNLQLSVLEKQILDEYESLFIDIGFSLNHFQGDSFVIHAAPLLFKGRNIEKIIRDMLEDLSDKESFSSIDLRSQRMITFLSCRAAVKAGDKLSIKQMRDLVHTLEKTENNTTCPHGRPTKIEISLEELHKSFKRK